MRGINPLNRNEFDISAEPWLSVPGENILARGNVLLFFNVGNLLSLTTWPHPVPVNVSGLLIYYLIFGSFLAIKNCIYGKGIAVSGGTRG
jgi:hypothetical protein